MAQSGFTRSHGMSTSSQQRRFARQEPAARFLTFKS
jgi:hypothetical protein